MDSEQDDAGLCQRGAALHRDLPEVLVEGRDDAGLGVRQIQQGDIACSGEAGASPQEVVPAGSKRVHDRLRNDLIGEESQLRRNGGWNRESLVLVGEVAGVCEAGEDVLTREAGVVGETPLLKPKKLSYK
jgi:hypothetical protein